MKGETYEQFVEKFKPKRTTDDCYTPPQVYETVLKWVRENIPQYWDNTPPRIIRPFYPGGNYENLEQYTPDSIVVDNPPFSIYSRIIRFYQEHSIRFFLFAPMMTMIRPIDGLTFLPGWNIIYENGANVRTGFVTNLTPHLAFLSSPSLIDALKEQEMIAKGIRIKKRDSYEYPENVISASFINKCSFYSIPYTLERCKAYYISNLDGCKLIGKSVFGDAFLISDLAAQKKKQALEKVAMKNAITHHISLSTREQSIVETLSKYDNEDLIICHIPKSPLSEI